ncbi:hypothetical protein HHK36_011032 [Tetracentron sinense]|uniref:Uncharacterized protein n=1 Tax=Tetracentron sinense TaxID=13715 RepID=A0A834Z7C7_TETSI|nr:hypothetical protein HHK36_011032 [Tetracentron sinense]
MPFVAAVRLQSFPINNGGSHFRIGWAAESDPHITFPNVVQRPRHKAPSWYKDALAGLYEKLILLEEIANIDFKEELGSMFVEENSSCFPDTGETVTIVGDHDPALMKYFDCTRSSQRLAFDSDVVYQFEIMEYILDFGVERMVQMDLRAEQVDHPILISECVCNPVQSRSKLAELLFESYGVPSVAFGVDTVLQIGMCKQDPCRTNIGDYHVTDYLKQLLSLTYPHHMSNITWEKVEDLKIEHCYIAPDYASENGAKETEEKTKCWQLPWVPPPAEQPTSEE